MPDLRMLDSLVCAGGVCVCLSVFTQAQQALSTAALDTRPHAALLDPQSQAALPHLLAGHRECPLAP